MTRRSISEHAGPSLAMRNRRRSSIMPRQEFILRDAALKDVKRGMRVSKLYNRLWIHFGFCTLIFVVLLLQRDVFNTHSSEEGLTANLEEVRIVEPNGHIIQWMAGTSKVKGVTTVNNAWTWAEAMTVFFVATNDFHEVSQTVCCVRVKTTTTTGGEMQVFVPVNATLAEVQTQLTTLRANSNFHVLNKNAKLELDPVLKERFTRFITAVRILMEVRAGGLIRTRVHYRTTRSTFYRTTTDFIRLFLELNYFFIVVFRIYKAIRKGRSYLKSHSFRSWMRGFWGPLEMLDAFGHAMLACMWVLIAALPLEDKTDPTKLIDNVHNTFIPYDIYFSMAFLLTIIMMLKLFKYIDTESKYGSFFHTIQLSAVDIVHFLLVMIVLLAFYAVLGFFLFGDKLDAFDDPQIAFQTIVEVILSQFDELRGILNNFGDVVRQRWIPRLYFWSLIIFMNLVLLNMFIAIVLEAYAALNQVSHLKSTVWHDVKTGLVLRYHILRNKIGLRSKNVILPHELYNQLKSAPVVINFHTLTQDVCGGNPLIAEQVMRRYGHNDDVPSNPLLSTDRGGGDASSVNTDNSNAKHIALVGVGRGSLSGGGAARNSDPREWDDEQVMLWLVSNGLPHNMAPNFENYSGKELWKLTVSDWEELAGKRDGQRLHSLLHPDEQVPGTRGGPSLRRSVDSSSSAARVHGRGRDQRKGKGRRHGSYSYSYSYSYSPPPARKSGKKGSATRPLTTANSSATNQQRRNPFNKRLPAVKKAGGRARADSAGSNNSNNRR